jgi:hypothetical protein
MAALSGARTAQRRAVNAAMSTEISVQAVAIARPGSDSGTEPKPATSEAAQPPAPAPNPSPIINPTLRLEPALGLVVIEFRNDDGTITTSIPSQRQIEAYQRWEATRIGPGPAGHRALRQASAAVDGGAERAASAEEAGRKSAD